MEKLCLKKYVYRLKGQQFAPADSFIYVDMPIDDERYEWVGMADIAVSVYNDAEKLAHIKKIEMQRNALNSNIKALKGQVTGVSNEQVNTNTNS